MLGLVCGDRGQVGEEALVLGVLVVNGVDGVTGVVLVVWRSLAGAKLQVGEGPGASDGVVGTAGKGLGAVGVAGEGPGAV